MYQKYCRRSVGVLLFIRNVHLGINSYRKYIVARIGVVTVVVDVRVTARHVWVFVHSLGGKRLRRERRAAISACFGGLSGFGSIGFNFGFGDFVISDSEMFEDSASEMLEDSASEIFRASVPFLMSSPVVQQSPAARTAAVAVSAIVDLFIKYPP